MSALIRSIVRPSQRSSQAFLAQQFSLFFSPTLPKPSYRQHHCTTTHHSREEETTNAAASGVITTPLPPRDSRLSTCTIKDIVGNSGPGFGSSSPSSSGLSSAHSRKLPAGELLGLIDICAARTASKHCTGNNILDAEKTGCSVVTVAFDRVVLKQPIMVGDQVCFEGNVVQCGNTSVAVAVTVHRVQFPTRKACLAATAVVFMVVVDKTLRPKLGFVPPVLLSSPALQEMAKQVREAKAFQKAQQSVDKEIMALLLAAGKKDSNSDSKLTQLFDDPINDEKLHHVPICKTVHTAHRMFFSPGYLNLNNTVFGGELLRWIEEHAVHCARYFSGNRHCVTIVSNQMEFKTPIYRTDWLELKAHVVYVRNTTMVVDVEVTAERHAESGQAVSEHQNALTTATLTQRVVTHRATFIVVSLDDAGKPMEVSCGLDVSPLRDATLHSTNLCGERCEDGKTQLQWAVRYATAKQHCAEEALRRKGEFSDE